jgi:large subunit ribosomal protein L17e
MTLQARGSDLRVHFKNTRETAMAIKGMKLEKALRYLEDVKAQKQIIPFRRFKVRPHFTVSRCSNLSKGSW